ncbi:MAG: NAD(P)H-dependent oxidoreductase [bacterium]
MKLTNNKVLVVFCHPSKKSLNYYILQQVLNLLNQKKIDAVVRDLYEIGFNPVLRFDQQLNTQQDVLQEQEYVKQSDLMIFIFPTWWGHMPAVLKGYIDRVFSFNFAYTVDQNNQSVPLLSDKKAIIITTLGGDENTYKQYLLEQSMKRIYKHIIFEFCGIELLEQIFIYSAQKSNEIAQKVQQAIQTLEKLLSTD